ncbi:MAG TPA: hypothetical protein DCM14_08090 [Clostridiales bacterium UBA8153]|nr:hypothetical protein [Clostridiales bacterium UBA8153]
MMRRRAKEPSPVARWRSWRVRDLPRWLGPAWRLVRPLAHRQLARHGLQSAMVALVVAGAVASYLVMSAAGAGAAREAMAQVRPVPLFADVLAYAPGPLPADIDRRMARAVEIGHWEMVAVAEVYTASGRYTALGLSPTSRLLEALTLTAGRWPSGTPAGVHGHAVFPDHAVGISPGTITSLEVPGRHGWHTLHVLVTGLYRPPGAPFSGPLVDRETLIRLGDPVHQGVVGWLSPRYRLTAATARLARMFPQGTVVTRDTPGVLVLDLTRRAWSPVLTVMGLVVALAAAGLFSLMLLSFLRRKRYLGMLKALGLESSELGLLLVMEAGLMSVLGLITGWGMAAGLIWQLNRFHEPALRLGPGDLAASVLLAAGVLVLGSFIPVTLSRRATVDQLLHNRRVYLSPNPSCAQCGRCGGF